MPKIPHHVPADGQERREYLIDGFRVASHHHAAWHCACREFGTAGTCRHTRESAGMRDAQLRIRQRLLGNASGFRPHVRRVR
jgi:hypothetical protein